MILTKPQRTDLWRAIGAGGLDPGECKLEKASQYEWQVTHDSSRAYLKIQGVLPDEPIASSYHVGWQIDTNEYVWFHSRISWAEVLSAVQAWAEEVIAPDLWTLGFDPKALTLGGAYAAEDNRPFTAAEQAEISGQIREIKESLKKNHELTAEQLEHIEERLDEAEEASRRMGRKDWILLFSGAVFSLILTDLITPDIAQHIITMTIHGLGHLFGSGGPHIRGALRR